ncbi:two-component sensor histidine kinase [Actinophytocola xanthii]|uniref:histidine kinase n=1 Tax=Actinophytocola xanthii TaxID=1912961 RepID=A0A1Q8CST6_9PSEU|nr:two-component sensor histidine kinase [Actinophytocola xanthii]
MAVRVGAGVGFAVALVLQAVAVATSWGGRYWWFGCAAGLVVWVLAEFRGRIGAGAAWAGLAVAAGATVVARAAELPSEPGPATLLGLSVLVGASVRRLPARTASAVAGGGAAVVVATAFLAPAAPGLPGVTVLNGLGWFTAVAVGLGLRLVDARQQAVAERVRHEERAELARELHDVVAHHVTGIVLQAQAARVVRRRCPERLEESLAGIEAAGTSAMDAMRRVVGLLRDTDDAVSASPAPERLDDLVRRFDAHGPAVRLHLPDGEPAWPPEVGSTVYRVVQESLTNVVRHAPHAGSVTISVTQDERAVTVEVLDDGRPARHTTRAGFGLVGMGERVEALGGRLDVGPRSGAGWRVRATLPVRLPEVR